jgi:low affinity Fe/Cu permease
MTPSRSASKKAEKPEDRLTLKDIFSAFSERAASATGSPWAFALAVLVLLTWGLTGPVFGFSDTWQLVINTATTIVTFVMVFIIQSAENRDTRALQIKLDEVLEALHREQAIDIEDLTETELERLQKRMADQYGGVHRQKAR